MSHARGRPGGEEEEEEVEEVEEEVEEVEVEPVWSKSSAPTDAFYTTECCQNAARGLTLRSDEELRAYQKACWKHEKAEDEARRRWQQLQEASTNAARKARATRDVLDTVMQPSSIDRYRPVAYSYFQGSQQRQFTYSMSGSTNVPNFKRGLQQQSLVWLDHIWWSAFNMLCLAFFWTCAASVWVWQRIFPAFVAVQKWICPSVVRGVVGKVLERWFSPRDEQTRHSFLSAETPNTFREYEGTVNLQYAAALENIASVNLEDTTFNLDNAIFFSHLCALVYEDGPMLQRYLERWHLEWQPVFDPPSENQSVHRAAWVVYHSARACQLGHCKRPNQNFIVVVFKGTSPFDLVEWMTDFTMTKIKPHGDILPGMVHEGFYNQIQWPVYLREPGDGIGRWTQPKAHEGFACSQSEIDRRLLKDVFRYETSFRKEERNHFLPKLTFYERLIRRINWILLDRFPLELRTGHKVTPRLWVTGHSLGGALASLFFAHLLHAPTFPLTPPRYEVLKGGYTFGAPCTGDLRYADEINWLLSAVDDRESRMYCFFDVINANDVVTRVPVGSQETWVRTDGRFLTNFSQIGSPVLINHWISSLDRFGWRSLENERPSFFGFRSLVNWFLHATWFLPSRLFTSGAKLRTVLFYLFYFWLPFFFDHYPSEYIKHLQRCKLDRSAQLLIPRGEQ